VDDEEESGERHEGISPSGSIGAAADWLFSRFGELV